jgi:hypothetical protein
MNDFIIAGLIVFIYSLILFKIVKGHSGLDTFNSKPMTEVLYGSTAIFGLILIIYGVMV